MAKEILVVVEDRGKTTLVGYEQAIQIARMEPKWAIGEDADEIEKVKTRTHDIMEAPRASKRPEEGALLKACEKKEATELLMQGCTMADSQDAAKDAISMSGVPAVDT